MRIFPATAILSLRYSQQPEQRSRWLSQLAELIAFPSISAIPQHRQDLKACAQWLARHLAEIGLQHVQILPGAKGGHPSVYADWLHAPGKPTLLLYGHYDVQPVDPLKEWRTPPFTATIVGDNLYARGASDDKEQLHRRLGIPIVLLGFGLPDDAIHAPNEKISLSNLFQGIATVIQFLAEYAR